MGATNDKYLIGCNYWASGSGINMWKNYDKKVVRKDMRVLSVNGINCIRVFPLWKDFAPLAEMACSVQDLGEERVYTTKSQDKPINLQKFPNSGLDENQVLNLKHLLATAKEFKIKVVVSLLTGCFGERKFIPEPFYKRDLVLDAEVVLYECAYVKDLVGEIKDCESILAYEPGNQIHLLNTYANAQQVKLWINVIADAIRVKDNQRPVWSGVDGLNNDISLTCQSNLFDALTVQPNPYDTDYCALEKVSEMRSSMQTATSVSYLNAVSNKPIVVEDFGDLSQSFISQEVVSEYFENAFITSLQAGAEGFNLCSAFDQSYVEVNPFDTNCKETSVGLIDKDYNPKPILSKVAEMSKVITQLPKLPQAKKDGCVIIPSKVDQWAMVYASNVMAVQNGRSLDYVLEGQPLKDYDYYILPCVKDASPIAYSTAKALVEKVKKGAKLLISSSGGTLWDFEELTGLKVTGRENLLHTKHFIVNGKRVAVDCPINVELKAKTAKVLAKDDDDRIALAENKLGKGSVLFLNAPLEEHFVKMNYPENTELFEVYKCFFKQKKKVIDVKDSKLYVTVHEIDAKKSGILIYNFNKKKADLSYKLSEGFKISKTLFGSATSGKLKFDKKYMYIEITK